MKRTLLFFTLVTMMTCFSFSAHAYPVLNSWNMNLSLVNPLFSDATNIDYLSVAGESTVYQEVYGGVALGNPFTEDGYLEFQSYYQEGAAFASNWDFGGAALSIYGYFENLEGVLNLDGSVTFTPGAGFAAVYLTSDIDADPNTNPGLDTELYQLEIIAPSGGSNLDFYGGSAADSNVAITAKIIATAYPGLFTDSSGEALDPEIYWHLVNTNALLDDEYSPNPDNTGINPLTGDGISTIHVENAGQYKILVTPEPTTMLLLGLGFLGLAGLGRKKFLKKD